MPTEIPRIYIVFNGVFKPVNYISGDNDTVSKKHNNTVSF